jgi:hypothetical protein
MRRRVWYLVGCAVLVAASVLNYVIVSKGASGGGYAYYDGAE